MSELRHVRDRYCPRCNHETRWFNVEFLNNLNRWICDQCDLEEAGLLTDQEIERWNKHLANTPEPEDQ